MVLGKIRPSLPDFIFGRAGIFPSFHGNFMSCLGTQLHNKIHWPWPNKKFVARFGGEFGVNNHMAFFILEFLAGRIPEAENFRKFFN